MKNLTSTGKLTKEYKEYLEKVRKESIENPRPPSGDKTCSTYHLPNCMS